MNRLESAKKRRKKLRKRRGALRRQLARVRVRLVKAQKRVTRIKKRRERLWTKIVGLDGTPMYLGHKIMLLDMRANGWNGVAVSSIRWDPPARRFGKMSQERLYRCSQNCTADCRGNCNPANPPGRSTHEQRSDGVAYRGPAGRKLKPWQVGLDLGDAAGADRAARNCGYAIRNPYRDPREAHHRNLTQNPTKQMIERGLV